MTFAEAYNIHRQGKKIKRYRWSESDYISIYSMTISIDDALADDWEIIPENKHVCHKCNGTGQLETTVIEIEKHPHSETGFCIVITCIDYIANGKWKTKPCYCRSKSE